MAEEASVAASAKEVAAHYATNRRHWDEVVGVHLAPGGYDLTRLERSDGSLGQPVEGELAEIVADWRGLRVMHLQCHFGLDTLLLAQRGAEVVGVDFSPAAIAAARDLAARHGLAARSRFVECNLYDAPAAIGEAGGFDLVFVTWGTISWLPDIRGWARVVAHFLKPGGRLYFADAHPAALVLDDAAPAADGMPGWFAPYFQRAPLLIDSGPDYANPAAAVENRRIVAWMHPLGEIVTALIEFGLRLQFLREHDGVPWRMFSCLTEDADRLFRWPDRVWLPLAFSLAAERT